VFLLDRLTSRSSRSLIVMIGFGMRACALAGRGGDPDAAWRARQNAPDLHGPSHRPRSVRGVRFGRSGTSPTVRARLAGAFRFPPATGRIVQPAVIHS
jgi:hypothetical protein